ncbi:hypothetical protein [Nocardia fluminea]|uniref:hypothetical protein n=1 Tax=Nocardia fluminea TaxID=134984 RepID=UPI00342DB30B
MKNILTYSGHYMVDRLTSRARCRIKLRGRTGDLGRADTALIAAGWTRLGGGDSQSNVDSTECVYARAVRVSMSDRAIEDICHRVHTMLFDAFSDARVESCSLERIRYQDWVFEHVRPSQDPLVFDGHRVNRLAQVFPGSSGPPNAVPEADSPTNAHAWSSWFKAALVGLMIGGAGLMYSIAPIVSGLEAFTPMYLDALIIGVVLLAIGLAAIGAQRLYNRRQGRSVVAPPGLSLWQLDVWARNVPEVDREIVTRVERFGMWVANVAVVAACLCGGALLGLASRFMGYAGASTMVVVAVIILLWVLGWEMVRSRAVKSGSRALSGLASVAMVAGVAAFVTRIPSWSMYQPFGYPGLAAELGIPDVLYNARVLILAVIGSAVLGLIYWIWIPHFPRFQQSVIGCVVFVSMASNIAIGAIAPGARSEEIVERGLIPETTNFRPGCLLQNDRRIPVWILGQTPRRLLVGDRTPSTESESPISNIRSLQGSSSYQVLHDNGPC